MTQDYATRYRDARDGLRHFAGEIDGFLDQLPVSYLDQVSAATRDAHATLARMRVLNPQQFPNPMAC